MTHYTSVREPASQPVTIIDVVDNAELAPLVGADPAWLLRSTGIEERRFAAAGEAEERLSRGPPASHRAEI